MLAILPPELILAVLSYLTVPTIHSLQLVSKEFDRFIKTNESTIYHEAAVVHGFVPSTAIGIDQLGQNTNYSDRIIDGINGSWRVLCRRRFQLEKSWRGKAPSKLVSYPATGNIVHRIKVDEKNGLIIASTGFWEDPEEGSGPALIVSDMKNPDKVLWGLPSTYVKHYAHIEYGNGYLTFDRLDGQKEVWRLALVKDPHPPPADADIEKLPIPYPQKAQLSASLVAAAEYAHTYPRGHFVPHALLQIPRRSRAFRFVYPTLLVGGYDHAFCVDVPSRQLIQTINPIQTLTMNFREGWPKTTTLQALGELNYVEVSERHVFICGGHALRVFSRETGGCVFDLPSTLRCYGHRIIRVLEVGKDATQDEVEEERRQPGDMIYHGLQSDSLSLIGIDTDVGESVVARLKTVEVPAVPEDYRLVLDEFSAVHVSSCGNHLVAMLRGSSRLILIKNFPNITFKNKREEYTEHQKESIIEVQLGNSFSLAQYLAFDEGKVVAVSAVGVFILDVNGFFSGPSASFPSAIPTGSSNPAFEFQHQSLVKAYRIPEFNDFVSLAQISCVQISACGIYLTWDPLRMRVKNGRWTILPRGLRASSSPTSGPSTRTVRPASNTMSRVEGSEDGGRLPQYQFFWKDPETDSPEVHEWAVSANDDSNEDSDDSEDDPWNTFADTTQVSHHTRRQQRDSFFFSERAFRVHMGKQGKHALLPTGDLMIMATHPDIQDEEDWEQNSTVCGVDFAVWD